jgi:hypothetical protein
VYDVEDGVAGEDNRLAVGVRDAEHVFVKLVNVTGVCIVIAIEAGKESAVYFPALHWYRLLHPTKFLAKAKCESTQGFRGFAIKHP